MCIYIQEIAGEDGLDELAWDEAFFSILSDSAEDDPIQSFTHRG